jgi:hypothetical protein
MVKQYFKIQKMIKMNRRSFVASALAGMGTVAFGSETEPLIRFSRAITDNTKGKKLLATTDYWDNIIVNKFQFNRIHFDSLHKYLASIGVDRHQWMYNPSYIFYEPHLTGYDLLADAVQSAHAHGLEFVAVIKPFEGGAYGNSYPHSLPMPENSCALKDTRGIFPVARQFVTANPRLCLKRRPGTYEAKGRIAAIRLIKGDNSPTRVKPEHLSLWISKQNNGFVPYSGNISFRESTEWRPTFPKSRECRIIHIEGLQIPEDHPYILVRCSLNGEKGDFTNERGSIIEVVSDNGTEMPVTLSTGQVKYETHRDAYDNNFYEEVYSYFRFPEVMAEFKDPARGHKHYSDFYGFNENRKITAPITLDEEGAIAFVCGKPEYMLGNLHPVYPEVRAHWLEMIRFCLDRGVDGINIRTSNHTQSPEEWEYGFNEPVLDEAAGRTDYPTIRRINGNAYTRFMHEARELVKSYGKNLTIHLYSQMLMPDDRGTHLNYIPPNFEWQWETWIRDIADDLEFRGAWTLRPWNLRQVLETFGAVTKEAGKPFYFQGNMKENGYGNPSGYRFTGQELELVKSNPLFDGFVLYETANFTRMDKYGRLEENPELEEFVKQFIQQ